VGGSAVVKLVTALERGVPPPLDADALLAEFDATVGAGPAPAAVSEAGTDGAGATSPATVRRRGP